MQHVQLLLFSSCDTYTGSGAYMGSSLGSILGSAIGGIADGPRGSDFGTIIGMAGGAAIGAAIGQAADQRRAAEKEEYQYDRAKRNYERKMRERQQNSDVSSYQEAPSTDSGYDETNSGDAVSMTLMVRITRLMRQQVRQRQRCRRQVVWRI